MSDLISESGCNIKILVLIIAILIAVKIIMGFVAAIRVAILFALILFIRMIYSILTRHRGVVVQSPGE